MTATVLQFTMTRQTSARQQIATHVRHMILSGMAPEGFKFPSNQELAAQWQVACSSVHAAMAVLVKEGLIERTPKRGTFVTQRSRNLTHMAIYLADNIWQKPTAAFKRAVVEVFCAKLKERNVVPDIWIDSRPVPEQDLLWPDLAMAAEQRRFQAILHCIGGDEHQLKWIRQLPVPVVAVSSTPLRNCVYFEQSSHLAVHELARLGCRSVGMIGPRRKGCKDNADWSKSVGIKEFANTAAALNLEVRDEWFQFPQELVNEPDAEQFGFVAMKHLLRMPQRPEGIFVTHDWVARGALMAVMENKIKVPDDLKLVLHRNVEVGFLCPVPVSFLDFSITKIVDGLINSLDAQLRGEVLEPIKYCPTISVSTEESRSLSPNPTVETVS
ncbi:MAG: substrate-binding domain-containing protein [Phycisphaerae bacterium]